MTKRIWNSRWLNGLVLCAIAAVMVHLSVPSDASRLEEPWPAMLSADAGMHRLSALQLRANVALEQAMQPADAQQPL